MTEMKNITPHAYQKSGDENLMRSFVWNYLQAAEICFYFLSSCKDLDLENQHFIIKWLQQKPQYLKFQKFNFSLFKSYLLPSPLKIKLT